MADDAPAFVDPHVSAPAPVALGARVAAGDEVDGRDKHKRRFHMAAWVGQVGSRSCPPSLLFVARRRSAPIRAYRQSRTTANALTPRVF